MTTSASPLFSYAKSVEFESDRRCTGNATKGKVQLHWDDCHMMLWKMKCPRTMILTVVLASSLGLAGCDYGLPPDWKTPVDSSQEMSKAAPRPKTLTSKPTDPLASKTRRRMIQVLRKLTDQRSAWLKDRHDYWLFPVGKLDREDPWDNAYRVWSEIREGSEPQRICVVLILASAGPDGRFATNDDIREESGNLLPGRSN
jgi:hypothetical protein